jgi:hypothetical protein
MCEDAMWASICVCVCVCMYVCVYIYIYIYIYSIMYSTFGRAVTRPLFSGFAPQKSGFAPRAVRMGFVVDQVIDGQVFLRVLRFFPVSVTPLLLHIYSCTGGWTIGPLEAKLPQGHSLTSIYVCLSICVQISTRIQPESNVASQEGVLHM